MCLLEAYNSMQKFGFICWSETYLDNSYRGNDGQLALPE